jgi:hypothetical protein
MSGVSEITLVSSLGHYRRLPDLIAHCWFEEWADWWYSVDR